MKIGELSKLTGVSTSTIRFYEKHGLIPTVTRRRNGYRSYDDLAVSRLQTIANCRELGFSLSEIRKALPKSMADMMDTHVAITNLERKIDQVSQQISQLRALRTKLRSKLDQELRWQR